MNTREGHRIIADEEEKTGVYIESGGPKSPTSAAADPLGERQQQPGSDGKICCDRVVRRVLSCRRCHGCAYSCFKGFVRKLQIACNDNENIREVTC